MAGATATPPRSVIGNTASPESGRSPAGPISRRASAVVTVAVFMTRSNRTSMAFATLLYIKSAAADCRLMARDQLLSVPAVPATRSVTVSVHVPLTAPRLKEVSGSAGAYVPAGKVYGAVPAAMPTIAVSSNVVFVRLAPDSVPWLTSLTTCPSGDVSFSSKSPTFPCVTLTFTVKSLTRSVTAAPVMSIVDVVGVIVTPTRSVIALAVVFDTAMFPFAASDTRWTDRDQLSIVPAGVPATLSVTVRVHVPSTALPLKAVSGSAGRNVPVYGVAPAATPTAAASANVVFTRLAPDSVPWLTSLTTRPPGDVSVSPNSPTFACVRLTVRVNF